MCEWMSQKTRTMPGRSNRDRLGAAGRIAPEIERRASSRARTRCGTCWSLFGKSTVVPGDDREHVRHERLVPLVHPRARLVARVERGARRRFQVDDAAAAVVGAVRRRHPERRDSGARRPAWKRARRRGRGWCPWRAAPDARFAAMPTSERRPEAHHQNQTQLGRGNVAVYVAAAAPVLLHDDAQREVALQVDAAAELRRAHRRVPRGRRAAEQPASGNPREGEPVDAGAVKNRGVSR